MSRMARLDFERAVRSIAPATTDPRTHLHPASSTGRYSSKNTPT